MLTKIRKVLKPVALFLALNFIAQIVFPTAALALTSGPVQPEYSSFEPVATTNMVNEFSGEFTYNLPLLSVPGAHGGGYPVSLAYHSGVKPEEEASWVGYGWTLNPGAINRSQRGFADDADGQHVTYMNKQENPYTISVGGKVGLGLFSIDMEGLKLLNISASGGIRYNNYKGFGLVNSVGFGLVDGIASVDFSFSEEGHSFSGNFNPAAIFSVMNRVKQGNHRAKMNYLNNTGAAAKNPEGLKSDISQAKQLKSAGYTPNMAARAIGSNFGTHLLEDKHRPTFVADYTSFVINAAFNLKVNPSALEIGMEVGPYGNFTSQQLKPSKTSEVYGMMYAHKVTPGKDAMDYGVEKQSVYTRRDHYLSIPFQNTDVFNVSGEGIGGSFKLFNKKVGTFTPEYKISESVIHNFSIEFGAGMEFGGAFSAGTGLHFASMGNWKHDELMDTYTYQYPADTDEPHFFRFAGDKSGNVEYFDSDDPLRAEIDGVWNPKINGNQLKTQLNDRVTRSSLISYHTNGEMEGDVIEGKDGANIRYRSYNKSEDSRKFVKRDVNVNSGIGEFSIVNDDGQRYVYGLPVYSADEKSLSYSVNGAGAHNNYLVYPSGNLMDSKRIIGEKKYEPVATSFLLTEITTPDYIDRTLNGPSNDDFGGWTKFSYNQQYGSIQKDSIEKWFRWRAPYNGLSYAKNDLADPRDDMGNMSSGSKEIYYLETIETSTHVAYFVTNNSLPANFTAVHSEGIDLSKFLTGSGAGNRTDGMEAADDETAAKSDNAKGTKKLSRLERIVLFAKNDEGKLVGKPVKVVHLQYNEDGSPQVLGKNLPNSAYTGANGAKGGKLTLKRVWFEYEGIVHSKIRPYEFVYEYKKPSEYFSGNANHPLRTKYRNIIEYGFSDGLDYTEQNGVNPQNPDYSFYNIDAWGNYRAGGAERFRNMKPWVNQGAPDPRFDPAAWHLKQIKLPTGGEILVQYEQHEYAFVNDKKATALVSLKPELSDYNQNKYVLNLGDLNLNELPADEKQKYLEQIQTYLEENKIFFKFLFLLEGENYQNADVNHCNVDYLDGYTNATAYIENGEIVIKIAGDDKKYTLPKQVCQDHVQRNRGSYSLVADCSMGGIPAAEIPADPQAALNSVVTFFQGIKTTLKSRVAISSYCKAISYTLSYLKIPVYKAKKGGGVRVKRVLMYDNGLEAGDEALYGTEYFYTSSDGTSSGVATNEPGSIREENALVGFLEKRDNKKWYQKVISGEDKEQFEGPLGESFLPAASVGYARVISQNIHTGKTGTGFNMNEFYTCFDYPYLKKSKFEPDARPNTNIDRERAIIVVPAIFVNTITDREWATQGYTFYLNEMHGQTKRTAVYKGNYVPGMNESSLYAVSEVIYSYVEPGKKVKVLDNKGEISEQFIGKETEVAMEMKETEDLEDNFNLNVDLGVGVFGALPLPEATAFPYLSFVHKGIGTHITTKVVRYPAILKEIETRHDGVTEKLEHLVFDCNTGKPVVTRTYDEYHKVAENGTHDGSITTYKLPAAKIYKSMGAKSQNEGYKIYGNFMLHSDWLGEKPKWLGGSAYGISSFITLQVPGKVSYYNKPRKNIVKRNSESVFTETGSRDKIVEAFRSGKLCIGDLIELKDNTNNKGLYYIMEFDDFEFQRVYLQPHSLTKQALYNGDIDATVSFNSIEVIRSGYTNQLNQESAAFSVYGESGEIQLPVAYDGDQVRVIYTDNLIGASLTTYTDDWYNHFLARTYPDAVYYSKAPKVYEIGARGKWRPKSSYVFENSVNGDSRNFAQGKFYIPESFQYVQKQDFRFYSAPNKDLDFVTYGGWPNLCSSVGEYLNSPGITDTRWKELSRVTTFTPDGEAVEERNPLGIYSCVRMGYKNALAEVTGKNAGLHALVFESFENASESAVVNTTSHTGKKSYQLAGGQEYLSNPLALDKQIEKEGLLIKVWARKGKNQGSLSDLLEVTASSDEIEGELQGGILQPYVGKFREIARVGDWSLLEARMYNLKSDGSDYSRGQDFNSRPGYDYNIRLKNKSTVSVYIDDLRAQPCAASVAAYVYDPLTFRLLASFDDQHFGLIYQYNAEGKLIRKLAETERGLKTLSETQYNSPSRNRVP
jgi:hypothetical protein